LLSNIGRSPLVKSKSILTILEKGKTTFMEDDFSGRQPQWKMTSLEEKLSGRRPQWKTTSVEDNLSRRQPQWKTSSVEDTLASLESANLELEHGSTVA
jgi:hypothetical protein